MKRGRPRKPEEPAGVTWNQWQRLRAFSREPKLETHAGRLALLGELTDYQWQAVELTEKICDEYAKYLGLCRWAISPSFEVGIGRSPTFEADDDREKAQALAKDFSRIQTAISTLSRSGKAAFHELVIQRLACAGIFLPEVREGLDRIAVAFGSKVQKKRLDKSKRLVD